VNVRRLFCLLICSFALWAGPLKLFLKDGDYHLIREYHVEGDRVRYFSTERGDWEEIPVSLVDLDKTEKQSKAEHDAFQKEAQAEAEEEQVERALKKEIASVPMETGAYLNIDGVIKPLTISDYQIITDKKRQALKILSPVPILPGKATVVIKGNRSKFTVHEARPEFYFRPEKVERFGIVRLTPKKDMRLVENVSILPQVNQSVEDRKQVDVFQQELSENLYKVWPEKPLEPGEYAVMEFPDSGRPDDLGLLVWDFNYQP
jgi:hypothetical protein